MSTATICGQTVTLSPPTTEQALTLLAIADRLRAANIAAPPAADNQASILAFAQALGHEGWQDILALLASVTGIPYATWLEQPVHQTLVGITDTLAAWMPMLTEYLSGTFVPQVEAASGKLAGLVPPASPA